LKFFFFAFPFSLLLSSLVCDTRFFYPKRVAKVVIFFIPASVSEKKYFPQTLAQPDL
jgi:hypothetical protein